MAFTNFCARSGGSNLNAGTRTGDTTEPGTAAALTYASGNWVAATGVFTVASGDPVADGVAVGDFASVYADGSSVTGFVGRVTARTTTTITVSPTAKSGTAPTDGTGNRTLKIGGAWAGPSGTSGFPFGFAQGTMTNAAGDRPRISLKNDATYSITAAITHSLDGPLSFRGYTSSYGDGGKCILDGGTSGASFILLSVSGSAVRFTDIIFRNNGASGSENGVSISAGNIASFCVAHSLRGSGFAVQAGAAVEWCEAYSCNQSNVAGNGGFFLQSNARCLHCVSHDNTLDGYVLPNTSGGGNELIGCIADSNSRYGCWARGRGSTKTFKKCDFYNNGSDGIFSDVQTTVGVVVIESCNFVKNGGYGIRDGGAVAALVVVKNCGFGSGTQANTSGKFSGVVNDDGTVDYAADVTPWVDPANGDFRINLAAAKGAGFGSFTQTAASYSGAVGYPDIGAAQHLDSGGGGGSVVIGGGVG